MFLIVSAMNLDWSYGIQRHLDLRTVSGLGMEGGTSLSCLVDCNFDKEVSLFK